MSRSYRKTCRIWISKSFPHWAQRAYRHYLAQKCHEASIDFDPDRDWEELYCSSKEFGDWGTACGWPVPPNPDDSLWIHESYTKIIRSK